MIIEIYFVLTHQSIMVVAVARLMTQFRTLLVPLPRDRYAKHEMSRTMRTATHGTPLVPFS